LQFTTYSDLELLEAIRHDDEEAFTELFQRYWKTVHAMAYVRVRSEEVTTEIVQELFISLWDKRASQSIRHLPSYFNKAVKNKTLNHIEAQLVRKNYWAYYKKFIPGQENATENTVEFDELMEAVETGMEDLPEKSKKVFKLNRLEGRSISEIADMLQLSEKAIQYHITLSLKKLRLHLKDYIVSVIVVINVLL
jgi:RNA polymerase sigma-70 factor (ECF subfamily)